MDILLSAWDVLVWIGRLLVSLVLFVVWAFTEHPFISLFVALQIFVRVIDLFDSGIVSASENAGGDNGYFSIPEMNKRSAAEQDRLLDAHRRNSGQRQLS